MSKSSSSIVERFAAALLLLGCCVAFGPSLSLAEDAPGRDPKQPADEEYTKRIRD